MHLYLCSIDGEPAEDIISNNAFETIRSLKAQNRYLMKQLNELRQLLIDLCSNKRSIQEIQSMIEFGKDIANRLILPVRKREE